MIIRKDARDLNCDTLLLQKAKEISKWLIEVRREFHQYPELGMQEHMTAQRIVKYLDEMGIEYKSGVANTGVVGIIRGAKEGKTVALRADIDALPIVDQKPVSYKSKVDEKMHACGHDAHTTILLGTAKIICEMKEELCGNVLLIFQPAEETTGGALPMIKEGVLKSPKVDAVFGLHVDPELECGMIGIKYGMMNASSDMFDIYVYGKSTHGAYPHSGIDAVLVASHIVCAMQSVVARNVDPRDSAVISIGMINGGSGGNIICDKVHMRGTIRTLNPSTREMVLKRALDICTNTAKAFGANAEFIRHESYCALINHDKYVDIVKENGAMLLGESKVYTKKEASMGVEDFAYFIQEVPGAFFTLGCRNEKKGIAHDLHTVLFDIDEDCLSIGVAIQVANVLSVLNRSDKVEGNCNRA